jgi:hypothetical protein
MGEGTGGDGFVTFAEAVSAVTPETPEASSGTEAH